MPFVRRQRKYYKDGVEVPSSSITDFGSTKYYKNIVTTKYWKEITTGSKELEYACYKSYAIGTDESSAIWGYIKMPIGHDNTYYSNDLWYPTVVTSSSQLTAQSKSTYYWSNMTEDKLTLNQNLMGWYAMTTVRYPDGDLYIDTTTTTVVEGTPEDYTYTTEEITPVEVGADDDYDYTEFVPSTQFDNYEDNNKLCSIIKRNKLYNIVNPKNYKTLQINAVPNDAIITINNKERNSITAVKGSKISWSVKAEGYASQSGTVTLDEDTVLNITLNSSVYEDDQVIFESATAGAYEVEIAQDGNYEVYCIGGGGGGAHRGKDGFGSRHASASGGSGSGFIGVVSLLNGSYNISVGTAGAYTGGRGSDGGDSYINTLIIAYGGKGGYVPNLETNAGTPGAGGAIPSVTVETAVVTLNTQGNTGRKEYASGSTNPNLAGGASVYNGYGAGGTSGGNGAAGYVKIVWKG